MALSPAALVWPYEWVMVLIWSLVGLVFYLWARTAHSGESDQVVMQELKTGPSDLPETAPHALATSGSKAVS